MMWSMLEEKKKKIGYSTYFDEDIAGFSTKLCPERLRVHTNLLRVSTLDLKIF